MGASEFPWSPLPLAEVVARFRSAPVRWWVSGGHALELHLGRSWRDHDDVDVGVLRGDVGALARVLPGWQIAVAAGGRLRPWRGEPLADGENNLWARDADGPWRIDVTVGDGDADRWRYRRDPRLSRPWDRAVLTGAAGVPYLAPELQLLFKSAPVRPKDDVDARVVIPELGPGAAALLGLWLPAGHPWAPLVAARRRPCGALAVLAVLDALGAAGVVAWVDGGWAVDALLGVETRPHADLDLAMATRQLGDAERALAARGFALVGDHGPFNRVVGDAAGVLVDLHGFDDRATVVGDDGVERFGPDGLAYEAGGMGGRGVVAGRPVRCIDAATLVRYHTGYAVDDDDWHDVRALHRRFGVPIPDDYARWVAAEPGA